jgi:hypothetical protein
MGAVLVIPAGDTADSKSWTERDGVVWTWAQVAADNGCERCEPLDGAWCTDRAIDGLGIRDDAPIPEPVVDVPTPDPVPSELDDIKATLALILSKLGG